MNIFKRLLGFGNKGVHQAKNEVAPEIIMIQTKAKIAVKKAEDTAQHMKELERDLKKLTAYKVAVATGRIK